MLIKTGERKVHEILYLQTFCTNLKMCFWEYSFIINKHKQKPTDMFNKQDVTVYFIY